MRIVFLLTQSLESPSGLGRFGPLAKALAMRGIEVEIVALHHDWAQLPSHKRVQQVDGVTIRYVSQMHVLKRGNEKLYFSPWRLLWVTWLATLRLTRQAIRQPADLIMVAKAQPMNGVAGWLATRVRRLPLWVDVDDHEAASNRFGGRWQQWIVSQAEQWLPRQARWVTSNTYASIERLVADGVARSRLTYLPNGFDGQRLSLAVQMPLRESLKLRDAPVVLYLGSLSLPSHPVHLLIEAWSTVQNIHPTARLLIVGGGEDGERLREQAKRLNIEDVVCFTGRVPPNTVAAYYRLATLSVDPVYDDESARGRSPLKLFESLACGTPVITSDVGERAAILGEAGALVAAGDSAALAKAINELLSAPERLATMSTAAAQPVAMYEWNKLSTRVIEMLDEPM
ncbi:MAG: glycosyltransferase family 4 protein [Ardenticatenaceae bacterium]